MQTNERRDYNYIFSLNVVIIGKVKHSQIFGNAALNLRFEMRSLNKYVSLKY